VANDGQVRCKLANILLIEDDETLRFTVSRALEKASHTAISAESIEAARGCLESSTFDLVLTDVHLGTDSGIDFVQELRGGGFVGGIIVMTAYATVDDAVRAMKLGADDYLAKPVRLEELTLITERLIEQYRQSKQLRLYQRMHQSGQTQKRPIGHSGVWMRTIEMAERLAKIPVVNRSADLGSSSGGAVTTVLITGETGAGKGVIARHIHASGQEPDQPFVQVNCTALPSTLIESELFGHEKGAFTDAKETREGLFEMADGGTIFLDEIGDLPLALQAKLLTVLEEGKIRRVGSSKERTIRVRVLAATNRDLESKVKDGTFREDLLFRINAFTLKIPNLRDRGDDALLIGQHLLNRLRKEYGQDPIELSADTIAAIRSHQWAGNVRELFNGVQRAAMLCAGEEIEPHDLGLEIGGAPSSGINAEGGGDPKSLRFNFETGPCTAEEIEKILMLQALEHTRGNVSKAARLIGMQRSSFRYRIERYGIEQIVQEIVHR
jgi:two-component system, NtrC family, response regulator AtoC